MVYSSQIGQLARHMWNRTLRDTAMLHLTVVKILSAQIGTLGDAEIVHMASSPIEDIAKNSLAWGSNFQVFRQYDLDHIGSAQFVLEHRVLNRVLKYIVLGRSVLEYSVLEHIWLEYIRLEYMGLE